MCGHYLWVTNWSSGQPRPKASPRTEAGIIAWLHSPPPAILESQMCRWIHRAMVPSMGASPGDENYSWASLPRWVHTQPTPVMQLPTSGCSVGTTGVQIPRESQKQFGKLARVWERTFSPVWCGAVLSKDICSDPKAVRLCADACDPAHCCTNLDSSF